MRKLVDTYLDLRRHQLAAATYQNTKSPLVRLAAWWDNPDGGHRKVPRNMTRGDAEHYLWTSHECSASCGTKVHAGAGLRDTAGPRWFNIQLGTLIQFAQWGAQRGEISPEVVDALRAAPHARVKLRRSLRLTPAQLGELIEGCSDPWERFVCALGTYSAGRSGELVTLTIGDVDLDEGIIEWNRHKTRDDADSLPITDELASELRRWFGHYESECGRLRDHWFLVPRRTCSSYLPETPRVGALSRVVRPHLSRVLSVPLSEVKQEGVHTLRRSMARALYERLRAEKHGDPIGVVQALLGHANRSMTEKYIGVESGREQRDSLLRGRSMFGG